MKPLIPVFLSAFANDKKASLKLADEQRFLREATAHLVDNKQLEFHSLGHSTIDGIYRSFNRFHNRICVFHYGGHSDSMFLELEDVQFRASSIGTIIGMQKELQLVFLNGCSNYNQVQQLFDKGVKAVIATSANIDDTKSITFAKSFYEALANGKSIHQSFETAKSRLHNDHPDQPIYRGIGRSSLNQFAWGLYHTEAANLDWTIPIPITENVTSDFLKEVEIVNPKVNKVLVQMAFEGLSKYKSEYALMWNMYQKNPSLFNTLQNMLIGDLPTPLSVQVRDLFTREGSKEGRRRLMEINEVYLTLVKLLCSISLSNLWEAILDKEEMRPKENFIIREEYHKDLTQFANLTPEASQHFDYVWLIGTISRIFRDNNIQPFISEFEDIHHSLKNIDEYYSAYRFMEQNVRSRLLVNDIDIHEVEELCEEAERNLGLLLKKSAFLCTYQFIVVKDIAVKSPRRIARPKFKHNKAILKGHDYVLIDRMPIELNSFISNNSVIVTKALEDDSLQLNLAPFLIDENAFKLKEETIPKIQFFNSRLDHHQYLFEHLEMQEDDFIVNKAFDTKKYQGLELLIQLMDSFRADFKIL